MVRKLKKLVIGALLFAFQMNAQVLERPMVVVVPSFNNSKYYQANLDSIFTQKYENYRVIYIDDASPDGTGALVAQYIEEHNLGDKVMLIQNEKNQGALYNMYHAIHSCNDVEIIIELDGDDRLAHEHVLSFINEQYADPNVWLTYGQYKNEPKSAVIKHKMKEIGYARAVSNDVVKNNKFRSVWVYMALRTYYAGLFKLVKKADLLCDASIPSFKGKFYPECKDLAMMYPMLEMAGERFKFIPDILYLRNVDNPINAFKVKGALQRKVGRTIRAKRPYRRLEDFPWLSRE